MIQVFRGVTVDLSVAGKTACPRCTTNGRDKSQDNLATYGLDSDGRHLGAFCFSCDYTIPSEDWIDNNAPLKLDEMEYELKGTEFNEDVHNGIKSITSNNSQNYRGITSKTSQFFGIRYEVDQASGSVASSYYPMTKGVLDGIPIGEAISGYKIRKHPKTFHAVGETGKSCDLFLQFRFQQHKGILVIAEGEVCALSAYQMLKEDYDKKGKTQYDEIAVVSGTNGVGGLAKQLQDNFAWLKQFNRVILMLDNDAAGRAATEECCKILPKGKAYISTLRYGDINEYLTQGKSSQFISDMWGAKEYCPAGVTPSAQLLTEAMEATDLKQISLPPFLRGLSDKLFGGHPTKEIFLCLAKTSVGKTTIVNAITEHLVLHEPDHIVGVLSLEADAGKYSRNLLSSHLKVNLNRMQADERRDFLSRDDIKAKSENLFTRDGGNSRFYVTDDRGAEIGHVKDKVEEMVRGLGVTILIVDPYSDLLSGMSVQEQEELATWIKKLQKECDVTPFIISHVRKSADNSGDLLVEDDAMGSSFLVKAAATTISLERNKQSECPIVRNTTDIYVLKNREFGETGLACKVYYDAPTATMYDLNEYKQDNPHKFLDYSGE